MSGLNDLPAKRVSLRASRVRIPTIPPHPIDVAGRWCRMQKRRPAVMKFLNVAIMVRDRRDS